MHHFFIVNSSFIVCYCSALLYTRKKKKSGFEENLLNRCYCYFLVGDRRIELLTSSVSRKRSTSELAAQRLKILPGEKSNVNINIIHSAQ